MLPRSRIPPVILIFFIIDLALGLAYIVNYLAGQPFRPLTLLLDLNGECNLPSWYSSMQWLCVAILLGIFAYRNFSRSSRRSWLLVALALLFLAFSVDEVAQIHEGLGKRTDIMLPGGTRKDTPFAHTGIWMFALGVPFILFFGWLAYSARVYFRRAPGAFVKLVLGMVVFLTGAIGIEALSNLVVPGSAFDILENFVEEVMFEMVGSTIVLWGSCELLDKHGFAVRFDKVATPPEGLGSTDSSDRPDR
jgi:hypothetical protein